MYSISPSSIASLNVDASSTWNVDRWWESFVPIEIAQETTSPFVDVHEALDCKDWSVFLDIRSKEAYKEAHISNSVSVPITVLDDTSLMPKLETPQTFLGHLKSTIPPNNLIIIVGDKSLSSNAFAKMVLSTGINSVCILRGGFDAVIADAPELIER
jgi:3-mercaptopyruvate sulfurtransferase SseA